MSVSVLLDTTLLIEQLKREKFAKPVREAMAPYRVKGASSYSKLEIKNAWLKNYAYIHVQCRLPTVESVMDVRMEVSKRLMGHKANARRVLTCLDQFDKFLELQSTRIPDKAQVTRLAAHCRHAVLTAEQSWDQLTTRVFRGTECAVADDPPSVLGNGALVVPLPIKCNSKRVRCQICQFFIRHKRAFVAIAESAEKQEDASPELRTMAEQIRLAQENPQRLGDRNHCSKLADAIIAIDGRAMDEFAANNDPEWRPIAQVLGKVLVNPVKGKRYHPGAASGS